MRITHDLLDGFVFEDGARNFKELYPDGLDLTIENLYEANSVEYVRVGSLARFLSYEGLLDFCYWLATSEELVGSYDVATKTYLLIFKDYYEYPTAKHKKPISLLAELDENFGDSEDHYCYWLFQGIVEKSKECLGNFICELLYNLPETQGSWKDPSVLASYISLENLFMEQVISLLQQEGKL